MRLELVAILLCSIRIRTMNTKFHEAQKSNYEHLELLLRVQQACAVEWHNVQHPVSIWLQLPELP